MKDLSRLLVHVVDVICNYIEIVFIEIQFY